MFAPECPPLRLDIDNSINFRVSFSIFSRSILMVILQSEPPSPVKQSYLDFTTNKGPVFLTEDTLKFLDPSHLSGKLDVTGRLGRVQNTRAEF